MNLETILVVDDDPMNLKAMGIGLGPDYQVQFASDGAQALQMAASAARPDLIMLDIGMPGMDGFEVCRQLKGNPATRGIPVIFVTGNNNMEDETRGFELGCVDFINKPTIPSILRARVSAQLALSHQNRRLEEKVLERTLELAMAEEHWRSLLEVAPDAMIVVDSSGRIEMANLQTTMRFGYGREELLGQSIGLLIPDPLKGRHAALVAGFSQAPTTRPMAQGQDLTGRRKDGTEFPVEVGLGVMTTPNGTKVLAAVRDITVRKTAELERKQMEAQLRHAQHMEAIGELAAGIAHEINTPNQYINDNTIFLRDAVQDLLGYLATETAFLESCAGAADAMPPAPLAARLQQLGKLDLEYLGNEIPKAIQQSLDGLARMAKIVSAMKDFSHPGSEIKVPTDLNHAIETTLTISRSAWKYVAEVVTDLQSDLPMVPCFPGEFSQAILNLVVNAAHAIESRHERNPLEGLGTIRVSSTLVEGEVEVRVADTGTGIPEELRARIFDPFFTTKPVGKGTGQGLAIAHSVIVKKLNGSIRVESELDKGTTFILRIPLAWAGGQG